MLQVGCLDCWCWCSSSLGRTAGAVLQWDREKVCLWRVNTLGAAAAAGHLDKLRWPSQQGSGYIFANDVTLSRCHNDCCCKSLHFCHQPGLCEGGYDMNRVHALLRRAFSRRGASQTPTGVVKDIVDPACGILSNS